MNALVLGYGSIGARRARILTDMGVEVTVHDADRERVERASDEIGALAYDDYCCPRYDTVFICTQPDRGRRMQFMWALSSASAGVFVEKPISTDELTVTAIRQAALHPELHRTTMGACNLRFCNEVLGMDNHIPQGDASIAVLRMSQHSKYWSSSHQRVSMILDSIHELDLAQHLFGRVRKIDGYSSLDSCFVEVTHDSPRSAISHIALDRVGDPPRREVTIVDRHGSVLRVSPLADKDIDGMYEREMTHFMLAAERGRRTCNPVSEACDLNLTALSVVT